MKRILAFVLCFSLVFATVLTSAAVQVNASIYRIEMSDKMEIVADKLVNQAIDLIHRFLMVVRYPWTPKTDHQLDLSRFELTFDDEFDQGKIDPNKWGHYSQGERKGGYWDEGQSFVRDGKLIIRTEYKEDGKYGPGYYTDRLATRYSFNQKYGYFEARCKLPAAQGLWSAFWVTARIKDGMKAKEGTEIDVFESPLYYRGALGKENNLVTSNLHYGGYHLGHRYHNVTISKVTNPYTEFNTYGVEWTPDGEYIFYINGQETGRSSFGGGSQVEQYMILSTEIDGAGGQPSHGWSGVITKNPEGVIPVEFQVEYVRAYQYKGISDNKD